jgi:hypothetical protein
MSEYEKQAEDSLAKHGLRFTTHFIGHGPHFEGEKDSRDNFRCIFWRRRARLVIPSFGQSLADSDRAGGNPPHPYEVLSCITKYDPGSFENFCGEFGCKEFGYEPEYRQAKKIYKATVREWEKVAAFFTDEELAEAREIS